MSAYPSERKASIRLLCLIVFLGHLAVASGTIFGLDGSKRVEVAENLIDHGRVDIQPTEFSPLGRDGKQYTQYAIGPSLVTIPFYLAGRTLARFVPARGAEVVEFSEAMVNLVATVLTVGCLALFAIELGFHLRTAVIIGLLYAFGTMAWQQSKDSFEHPQVALYFTVLFYLLHRFARLRQRRLLLAAGLSLGAAVLTRYTTVLVGTGVVAFLSALAMRSGSQRPVRDAVVWSALVALPAVPFLVFDLWFNAMRFGSMLETGQQQLFGNLLSTATVLSGLWGLTLSLSEGLFVFVPVLWDPTAVVLECKRLLKPGGLLVVNYPDIGSWISRLMGRRWVFLLSVHLYYFTRTTIRTLLERNGFSPFLMKPHFQTLELGYILHRMKAYVPVLPGIGESIVKALRLAHLRVPYWVGQTLVLATRS